MTPRIGKGVWLAAAVVLAGCGGDSLAGSLDELLPLDYDRVEVRLDTQAFVVEYVKEKGPGLGTVFKLVVATQGLDLTQPQKIDLADRLDAGEPRVSISRAVADEPSSLFPPIGAGELTLDLGPPLVGKTLRGDFGLHFAQDSTHKLVGAGRTVRGDFQTHIPAESPLQAKLNDIRI